MLWTRAAEGNKNSRVLDPGRGNQYNVRTKLSTLSILFSSSFFIYLSISYPHNLLYLSFVPLLAKVWGVAPRVESAVGKGGERE